MQDISEVLLLFCIVASLSSSGILSPKVILFPFLGYWPCKLCGWDFITESCNYIFPAMHQTLLFSCPFPPVSLS